MHLRIMHRSIFVVALMLAGCAAAMNEEPIEVELGSDAQWHAAECSPERGGPYCHSFDLVVLNYGDEPFHRTDWSVNGHTSSGYTVSLARSGPETLEPSTSHPYRVYGELDDPVDRFEYLEWRYQGTGTRIPLGSY